MKRSNTLEGPRMYENTEITQKSYLIRYISSLDPSTALV
jgi:hypothetical protein